MKNFKTYFESTTTFVAVVFVLVLIAIASLFMSSCNSEIGPLPSSSDAFHADISYFDAALDDTQARSSNTAGVTNDVEAEDVVDPEPSIDVVLIEEPSYPLPPYSLDLFGVVSNMTFYDPWKNSWIELGDFYKSEDTKAILLVSSAGWCGPCLAEAAALVDVYEDYHVDGLEIIYTLGNTNIPGDVPFDTTYDDPGSADFKADLQFMENWNLTASVEAGKSINYHMFADPKRQFLPFAPNHAWPFSALITTKDMGIRLVEEGYWSALIENKITMVLYNETPDIPFDR